MAALVVFLEASGASVKGTSFNLAIRDCNGGIESIDVKGCGW